MHHANAAAAGSDASLAGDSASDHEEAREHTARYAPYPQVKQQICSSSTSHDAHTVDGHSREDCGEKRTAGGKLQVKPRLRRRAPGMGGKQALGGRPDEDEEVDVGAVEFTPEMLREFFTVPLSEAARQLGICVTAIKKVCFVWFS
jgi:hypothetical protein